MARVDCLFYVPASWCMWFVWLDFSPAGTFEPKLNPNDQRECQTWLEFQERPNIERETDISFSLSFDQQESCSFCLFLTICCFCRFDVNDIYFVGGKNVDDDGYEEKETNSLFDTCGPLFHYKSSSWIPFDSKNDLQPTRQFIIEFHFFSLSLLWWWLSSTTSSVTGNDFLIPKKKESVMLENNI